MMDEQQLLNEINAIPWEQPTGNDDYRNALLVFADWLEEQGDPRSELIRLREGLLNDPTPQQRQVWEPRMQALIHKDVQPIQATWENSIGMKFCWCPPGKFTMGSPATEYGRGNNEDQVDVTLTSGFWLAKFVVTQGAWERVMQTKPWNGRRSVKEGTSYPAIHVSWEDAAAYCEKLTEQERSAGRLPSGWKYSLPTEAQWEYACRAGTTMAYSFGNDASQLSDYAWWGGIVGDGNAKNEPYAHEVGRKRMNAWGLHDLHGNVEEWCQDWYAEKRPGGTDPLGASSGLNRVPRGGSCGGFDRFCKSTIRYGYFPDFRHYCLGFRTALVPSGR